jgi:hypothetical protein
VELERSFGRLHAVPLGAIRTYLPGVDPASVVDARRHRILSASTIATQPATRLARTLGWANRARALNLPLPKHVSRVDRILSREEPAAALRSIRAGVSRAEQDVVREEGLTTKPGTSAEPDSREIVHEATQIAIEAAQEAAAAAAEAEAAAQDTASDVSAAPVEAAAIAAARDVTMASELLADLAREFAADLPGQSAMQTGAALVGQLRRLLAEGRSALAVSADVLGQPGRPVNSNALGAGTGIGWPVLAAVSTGPAGHGRGRAFSGAV